MRVTCEFCGHEGEYGTEIGIIHTYPEGPSQVHNVFACIDSAACDRRDAEREARDKAEADEEAGF